MTNKGSRRLRIPRSRQMDWEQPEDQNRPLDGTPDSGWWSNPWAQQDQKNKRQSDG